MLMKLMIGFSLGLGALVGIGTGGDGADCAKHAPPTAALEPFKKLAGEWLATVGDEKSEPGGRFTYRVTSAGSAVVETLFVGSDHEMVTVYHLDGNDIVLTHYCAMGNQPNMRAVKGTDPKTIKFEFAGGCNIKADTDAHMHGATFNFVDDDHVCAEWVHYADGKATETAKIFLTRKKA